MASDDGNSAKYITKGINWPLYNFEQTVRIIEAISSKSYSFGSEIDYKDSIIKLKPTVLFHVPSTEVISCEFDDVDNKFLLSCNRLAFEGIFGPLPFSYSDMILTRLRKKDRAAAEFVSIFHLRILGVSYRLSKKRFPALEGKKLSESFLGRIIASFLGNKNCLPLDMLIPYHITLWQRTRSISGLLDMIGSYFPWSITIKECVGGWIEGGPDQVSRIGSISGQWNTLGGKMMIGSKTWDQSKLINLDFGPLDYNSYKSIIMGGDIIKKIFLLVRHYCGVITMAAMKVSTLISRDQLSDEKIYLGINSWLLSSDDEYSVSSNYITLQ